MTARSVSEDARLRAEFQEPHELVETSDGNRFTFCASCRTIAVDA